jgi:hypothetical protein
MKCMLKWTVPLVAGLAITPLALAQLKPRGDGFHARMARLFHGAGDGDAPSCLARLLHGQDGRGEGLEAHLEDMATRLELSGAQRKQVASVLVAALPDLEVRAQALISAHGEQLERVHALQLDETDLRRASATVGKAQEELVLAVARLLRDFHAVLTAEQLALARQRPHAEIGTLIVEHVRQAGRSARTWAEGQ